MSHLYPLAASAADALNTPEPAARTRYEAIDLAGNTPVAGLETEWITPSQTDLALYEALAETGIGSGFVQRYEDASGAPVYAVTYWKLHIAASSTGNANTNQDNASSDKETDELYFRIGQSRTGRKKRVKKVDPRQLDLFVGPDQKGYEYEDPDNPGVIIADEEGDGTAFGIAPASRKDTE